MQVIRAMQEHIAEFTAVNEAFRVPSGYEIIFNAAGAGNMNREKVSISIKP